MRRRDYDDYDPGEALIHDQWASAIAEIETGKRKLENLDQALEWWARNAPDLSLSGEKMTDKKLAKWLATTFRILINFIALKGEEGGLELYIVDGAQLLPAESYIAKMANVEQLWGVTTVTVTNNLTKYLLGMAQKMNWRDVNPPDRINTLAGVLDLHDLSLTPARDAGVYFTYIMRVQPEPEVLAKIRAGQYNVEENQVYKLWRDHFDDENWWYFVSSVGTWLYPKRFRHLAWLVGARGTGKSSLLGALTRPIEPIVARTSLDSLLSYTFGMQGLIGKEIIVQNERAVGILRNIDALNRVFGESDYIEIKRKHRDPVSIPSMRSAMFSMNDLPLLGEKHGSTLDAFLDRLSIIEMGAPEDFSPKRGIVDEVRNEEALYFLLWARQRLEENGEVIEKRSEDELRGMVFEGSWLLAEFWRSCIEEVSGERIGGQEAYEAYLRWAKGKLVQPVGRSAFYDLMAQRVMRITSHHQVAFQDIRLRC
ncbi:MAG: hypothetical protein C0167_02730 [Nitrososphaera sp.]|nr:MAG: hypothetical protein C0167_02730 [Nitrososphaera sp.]